MFRSTKRSLIALGIFCLAACGGEPANPLGPERAVVDDRFVGYEITADADGPAGVEAADIDGDGSVDLIVNSFGDRGQDPGPTEFPPGRITIYRNPGTGEAWTPETVIDPAEAMYFPNEAHPFDLDDDGDLDLLVSGGFFVCEFNRDVGPCGSLFWMEQTEDGWTRHDIIEPNTAEFYHRVELVDLDGDGFDDLVTVAESVDNAEALWFRGVAPGEWDPEPQIIGSGGGSLPLVHDVDGDGDLDVASGQFFLEGASYVWFEQTSDGWVRHLISDQLGRTIQLSVIPDLFGDGVDRWVGSNHVASSGEADAIEATVHVLTPPEDPRDVWSSEIISEGIESRPTLGLAFQAAPGVFAWGDVDGDDDIDLVVSGDGDDRFFLFEQTSPGEFVQTTLIENFGQAAGGTVADIDGDGINEILITSYETHEVLALTLAS